MRKHEVVNEIKKLYFSGVYHFNTPNDYRGFWAVQKMLIEKSEIYFLLGMTIVASLIGAGISLFLLSPVFTSLGKLKEHAKRVADKDFPSSLEVQGPVEFQQLGQAFNEMSHDLQATFDSLEESEREKGLMMLNFRMISRPPSLRSKRR